MNIDIDEEFLIEERTEERFVSIGLDLPFPLVLPFGIREVEAYPCARVWRVQKGQHRGLLVIADVSIKDDGLLWYHVSFSRADKIPSYEDCAFVKETFVGRSRWAIQIFPEASNHVNYHPNCLHLWHCLEGRSFPEFSKNGMI